MQSTEWIWLFFCVLSQFTKNFTWESSGVFFRRCQWAVGMMRIHTKNNNVKKVDSHVSLSKYKKDFAKATLGKTTVSILLESYWNQWTVLSVSKYANPGNMGSTWRQCEYLCEGVKWKHSNVGPLSLTSNIIVHFHFETCTVARAQGKKAIWNPFFQTGKIQGICQKYYRYVFTQGIHHYKFQD